MYQQNLPNFDEKMKSQKYVRFMMRKSEKWTYLSVKARAYSYVKDLINGSGEPDEAFEMCEGMAYSLYQGIKDKMDKETKFSGYYKREDDEAKSYVRVGSYIEKSEITKRDQLKVYGIGVFFFNWRGYPDTERFCFNPIRAYVRIIDTPGIKFLLS